MHSVWSMILTIYSTVNMFITYAPGAKESCISVYTSLFLIAWWVYLLIYYKTNTMIKCISFGWILTGIGLVLDFFVMNSGIFMIGLFCWSIIFVLFAYVIAIKSQKKAAKIEYTIAEKILLLIFSLIIFYNIIGSVFACYWSIIDPKQFYDAHCGNGLIYALGCFLNFCLLLILLIVFLCYAVIYRSSINTDSLQNYKQN